MIWLLTTVSSDTSEIVGTRRSNSESTVQGVHNDLAPGTEQTLSPPGLNPRVHDPSDNLA